LHKDKCYLISDESTASIFRMNHVVNVRLKWHDTR